MKLFRRRARQLHGLIVGLLSYSSVSALFQGTFSSIQVPQPVRHPEASGQPAELIIRIGRTREWCRIKFARPTEVSKDVRLKRPDHLDRGDDLEAIPLVGKRSRLIRIPIRVSLDSKKVSGTLVPQPETNDAAMASQPASLHLRSVMPR